MVLIFYDVNFLLIYGVRYNLENSFLFRIFIFDLLIFNEMIFVSFKCSWYLNRWYNIIYFYFMLIFLLIF